MWPLLSEWVNDNHTAAKNLPVYIFLKFKQTARRLNLLCLDHEVKWLSPHNRAATYRNCIHSHNYILKARTIFHTVVDFYRPLNTRSVIWSVLCRLPLLSQGAVTEPHNQVMSPRWYSSVLLTFRRDENKKTEEVGERVSEKDKLCDWKSDRKCKGASKREYQNVSFREY